MIKIILWTIGSLVAVIGLSYAAHEAGHWIAGQAFGLDGSLILFTDNRLAIIGFETPLNDVMAMAGGLAGCLSLIVMLFFAKFVKDNACRFMFNLICWINLIAQFVYGLNEAFGLNSTWQLCFAAVSLVLVCELVIKGFGGLKNVQTI